MVLLLLSTLTALAGESWVAVREDSLACAGRGDEQQCVRLDGQGRQGAYLARLLADDGETVRIRWQPAPLGACLPGAPGPLAELGLELQVPAQAVLPVVAAPTATTMGDVRIELFPGQPLWPSDTADGVQVRLQGLQVALPAPGPTRERAHSLATSRAAGSATESSMPARVSSAALLDQLQAAGLPAQVLPGADSHPVTWDSGTGSITVQEACGRLRTPWSADRVQRPSSSSGLAGGSIGLPVEPLPQGITVYLPDGTPVGRTTTTVVLKRSQLRSSVDGRTCFSLTTTSAAGVLPPHNGLYLCAGGGRALPRR